MKKKTTFGLLGLVAAGAAGAAGGWNALGNYMYDQTMLPSAQEPDR